MWETYKRTFLRMQTVILTVTVGVLLGSRAWVVAMTFLFVMQIGSIAGAMLGPRLRKRYPQFLGRGSGLGRS
jgi:integral membrane sensor domain MASE1